MRTEYIYDSYLTPAMRTSIGQIEATGFKNTRILPVDLMSGIHSFRFRAYFIKQIPTGVKAFHVCIDTDGNIEIEK